ncbi:alpha/beta hydrolase [Sinorhizobium meliloti]|uniref:alpha/beta hydrolase n=1 Tax=Rhizobium meliloti TaxID=382 RepID=UPI003F5CF528
MWIERSSGAHLSACALTSLSLRQFDLSAVAGALLFYGTYDMAGTPSLRKSSAEALIMHGPSALENLMRLTSGMDEAQRRSPWLSPLFCDLTGLPPALFVVGELDPVLDDSLLMYNKWQNENHNATLLIVPEGPHGMNRLPTTEAKKINDFTRQWIRKAVERQAPNRDVVLHSLGRPLPTDSAVPVGRDVLSGVASMLPLCLTRLRMGAVRNRTGPRLRLFTCLVVHRGLPCLHVFAVPKECFGQENVPPAARRNDVRRCSAASRLAECLVNPISSPPSQ